MSTANYLHNKFNKGSNQIPPVRIRKFERKHLSELFAELGFTTGVEIGVAQGIHSEEMCQLIPGLKLMCVDPWEKYHWKHEQDEHERHYQETIERLKPFDANIVRMASMDAVRLVPDESFDFIYIDGDHSFDYSMMDLIMWTKKVKPTGIISGHDAYRFRGAGVVDAVSVYTHCHQVLEWFLCDEKEQSFFWAKAAHDERVSGSK